MTDPPMDGSINALMSWISRLIDTIKNPGDQVTLFDQTRTTNAYVQGTPVEILQYHQVLIWIKNKHESNSIDFKVVATANIDDWENIRDEKTLAPGESNGMLLEEPWNQISVEIKSTVEDAHGTIECHILKRRS